MARVGRGRSRGGRILDMPSLPTTNRIVGPGRMMIGRGISEQFVADNVPEKHIQSKNSNIPDPQTEAQKTLVEDLKDFVLANKGSIIHITLKYFNTCDDVQFYVDKTMDHLLKSSVLVEKFTMSYKLITLLKSHGDSIKLKMFSKLQTTFQDMQVLMKECDNLNSTERESVRNFCDLLGQFFFRFRVAVDSLQRYDVLAVPVLECLKYLVKAKGRHELKLLAHLLALNGSSLKNLQEEQMSVLWVDILETFFEGLEDHKQTGWLLCALQLLSREKSSLPPKVEEFYARTLDQGWTELPKSRTQMLADIPPDIVDAQIQKFDVDVEEYTKNRFVAL